jgi:hypothetical protein
MATMGLSWWIGLTLASSAGTRLLGISAAVTFIGSAVAAASAGVSMLALGGRLPGASGLTPRLD